jgi:hypothetical protein
MNDESYKYEATEQQQRQNASIDRAVIVAHAHTFTVILCVACTVASLNTDQGFAVIRRFSKIFATCVDGVDGINATHQIRRPS